MCMCKWIYMPVYRYILLLVFFNLEFVLLSAVLFLGKLLYLSYIKFSHLQNGDNKLTSWGCYEDWCNVSLLSHINFLNTYRWSYFQSILMYWGIWCSVNYEILFNSLYQINWLFLHPKTSMWLLQNNDMHCWQERQVVFAWV